MMLLALFCRTAAALSLVTSEVPLPDPATAVAVVERADGTWLVVGSSGAVRLLDPADGDVVDRVSLGVSSILARDVDGDGLEVLVVCGESGLAVIPWSSAGFGAVAVVDEAPCSAVVDEDVDEVGVATVGDRIAIW